MGREVRRVPADWQHPRIERLDHRSGRMVESYQPMFDRPFAAAMQDWYDEWKKWERGERPSYASEACASMTYWEWNGGPPDPAYHRPDWPEATRTHLMMYEDTSEGTPISPAFETPEELARWLVDNDASAFADRTASYEGWLAIARGGYAPSMVHDAAGTRSGVEAAAEPHVEKQ